MECLHAYGIHSATLQPEVFRGEATPKTVAVTTQERPSGSSGSAWEAQGLVLGGCQLACGRECRGETCCDEAAR